MFVEKYQEIYNVHHALFLIIQIHQAHVLHAYHQTLYAQIVIQQELDQ